MPEQKLSRLRVLLALLITIFLFVNIFLLAYTLSFLKQQKVAGIETEIRYNLLSFNVEKELLKSCKVSVLESISEDLDKVGALVATLEDRLGKNNKNVLEQKKLYVLMEIQHSLNIQDYSENCNKDHPVVFFFYSNQDEFEDRARIMGKILDTFKSQNRKVMVYSFDYDLNFATVELLKTMYNVKIPNVVVFDGSEPFSFNNIRDLNEQLD